jgi:hypothetical protein
MQQPCLLLHHNGCCTDVRSCQKNPSLRRKKLSVKLKEILFSKNIIFPHFNVTSDIFDDLTTSSGYLRYL